MDIRSVSSSPAALPVERDAGSRAVPTVKVASAPAGVAAATGTTAVTGVAATRAAGAADPLDEAISNINKSLQAAGQGVEFSVDDDSKRLVVKVVDQETREVLRQMPSVEALQIAKALDRAQGMLIKQEA